MDDEWDGVPPNGEGMYHWLWRRERGGLVVGWFDLHDWTIAGLTDTKKGTAKQYTYYAPCVAPERADGGGGCPTPRALPRLGDPSRGHGDPSGGDTGGVVVPIIDEVTLS